MSRAGYIESDECEEINLWRGAVKRAIRGKRGQNFLKEMLAALDAMPEKRLITEELEEEGQVCALGSVGKARGLDMSKIDPFDYFAISKSFGIAPAMVQEIEYENDEAWDDETPEGRWIRMRAWVKDNIKED